MALGELLTYTAKQKPQSAGWTVHTAWGQSWKDFLQLLFYYMQSKQLIFLAKPITSTEFLFCPTGVGKACGCFRWACSKHSKMWVELCSDCKETVCVCVGRRVFFFFPFSPIIRYKHLVELFRMKGFTAFPLTGCFLSVYVSSQMCYLLL